MSDKKYNLTLSRGYKTKNGAWSTDIGAAEFDALQQVQLGGRIVWRELDEKSRKKETSPHGYFQYMTPDEVKEFKNRTEGRPKVDNLPQKQTKGVVKSGPKGKDIDI